ncbi:thiamine phosphate synthase [Alicyclobacillus fastidiosus]|uniref:Thiamine-phosphate synthase n=1 Tax=Alicyclobacillus fastidiosus TaxID=392011 RepID=A0ABV5A9C7_9BACL|nr:thiamine phosphate synthase [Alicyclobacillus fastidiosus]WEH10805.1 thiamine phosphate synthase [Alicyclobacillus fastidiosus]
MRGNLYEALSLYVVTDEREDVDSLLTALERALAGGCTAVQLRRKREDGGRLVEIGRRIRELTNRYGALFFVNDRVDIALLTDADGVHIGQSDISCRDARKLMGKRWIGVSAGTLEEAKAAVSDGADYLGVGSIYPTSSKDDADLCGLSTLADIAQATALPIVAIGGIKASAVPEVIGHGADGIAVVSAVMSASDPQRAAVELKRLLAVLPGRIR